MLRSLSKLENIVQYGLRRLHHSSSFLMPFTSLSESSSLPLTKGSSMRLSTTHSSFSIISLSIQRSFSVLHKTVEAAAPVPATTNSNSTYTHCKAIKSTDVSHEELEHLLQCPNNMHDPLVLIDVRDPDEVEKSGLIPTAINIPVRQVKEAFRLPPEEFERRYRRLKPNEKSRNIVFYGLKEVKSATACEIAHSLGFKKARNYVDGWAVWSELHPESITKK